MSKDRTSGKRKRRTRGAGPGRRPTVELLVQVAKLLILVISLFTDLLL